MFLCRVTRTLHRPPLPPPPHSPSAVAPFSSSSSPSTPGTTPTRVLNIGDVLRLPRRFSESDVAAYARVSGDANPVHFDDEFARTVAGFDGRVVHGMLVASLFPTVIASHFAGAIYVSQTLQFKSPVFIGDEVVAEVQPIGLRKNKNRYIAKFLTKCFTNGECLVIDGEAMAVLPTLALKE